MGQPRTPLHIAFITRTRDDLVGLSRTLANNLNSDALDNADYPILWSNHGSYNGGKSLVADTVTSQLSSEDVQGYFESEAGMFGFDSEFHSFRDSKGRQYQFADIYFPWAKSRFINRREKLQRNLLTKILNGQTTGGIIFVHNAPKVAREYAADIEISIQNRRKLSHFFNSNAREMPAFARKSLNRTGLKLYYNRAKAQGYDDWLKLVELTIHNRDIFVPKFIEKLRAVEEIRRQIRESKHESLHFPSFPYLTH